MEMQIVALRDKALEAFTNPFFTPAIPAAVRAIRDAMKNPQHDLAKHPEDYAVYHFGTFNDSTGQLTVFETPQLVLELVNVSE